MGRALDDRGAYRLRAPLAVVLLALQVGGLGALSWESRTAAPTAVMPKLGYGPAPDLAVTLEYFADDALVVTTARGLRSMRLDESTTVQTITGPGRLADLRPGMTLVLWLRDGTAREAIVDRVGLIGPGRD
jgi:hypothetical protein